MPTLNTAASATVAITAPNGYITVDCSNGAAVDVSWISPGGVSGRRTVQSISEDVGPFIDGTLISLYGVRGTASYTYADSAALQALVADAGIPLLTPKGVLGTPCIDFSTDPGANITMVAQGGTCTIAYNPTGWHDGSGCLDWTPTGSSPTIRALLNGSLPFAIDSDDGWGIEFMVPTATDPTVNAYINVVLAAGGVSAGSVPTNNSDWRIYQALANAQSQKFNGVRYSRFRFDILNSDLKAGPVSSGVITAGGGGAITKQSLVKWWCLYATKAWLGKTIKIKRFTRGGRARPALVVTFDNNYRYHADIYTAYWNKLNWQVSAQLLTQAWVTGDLPYSNVGSSKLALQSMWANGSDLNANDIVDRSISPESYATIYAAAKQWQQESAAFGFPGTTRGQNMWVYNNNAYNDEPIRALIHHPHR